MADEPHKAFNSFQIQYLRILWVADRHVFWLTDSLLCVQLSYGQCDVLFQHLLPRVKPIFRRTVVH